MVKKTLACFVLCVAMPWMAAAQSLSVVWSVDVDGRKPQDPLAFAAPAWLAEGAEPRILIGGADARAHIYDVSGKELFRVPLKQNSDSGAVQLNDRVAVLGDSKGVLYGIDVQQGKVLWQFSLSSSMTALPVRAGHDVLVQTTDNSIYRIDAKGRKIWSFTSQQGGLGLYISAAPLLHDGRVFALLSNGDAVAIDARNGDLIWRKQLLLDTDATMLSQLKAPQATPSYLASMSFDGRVLHDVVLFPFYQGDIFVVSQDDGAVLHSVPTSLKSAPLWHQGVLYMADTHGQLTAVQAETGQTLWTLDVSESELLGPVLWQGALWVADESGVLFKVSLKGQKEAEWDTQGAIERLPVVTPNGLLIHHTQGGLYLVRG